MQLPSNMHRPNCLVASGLPWYVTELDCRHALARMGNMRYARLYEDALNGASRGMVLVQFSRPEAHHRALTELTSIGAHPVTVKEYHVSDRWDPTTAPPPLPLDPARDTISRGGKPFGFGPRCLPMRAVSLGDANTVSTDGAEQLVAARKRWRVEFEDSHSPPTVEGIALQFT
jgi:hypothetical protein